MTYYRELRWWYRISGSPSTEGAVKYYKDRGVWMEKAEARLKELLAKLG